MSRHRLCKACGEFHCLDEQWPLECVADADHRRSHLPCPSIRPDGMDALQSMADGQTYESRSAYYASVKQAGCEIVGDDRAGFGRQKTTDDLIPGNIGGDVKAAIEQLNARAA